MQNVKKKEREPYKFYIVKYIIRVTRLCTNSHVIHMYIYALHRQCGFCSEIRVDCDIDFFRSEFSVFEYATLTTIHCIY